MWNWIKAHYKKLIGGAVAAAVVFKPELAPVSVLGGILFGTDFQVGGAIGTPIGSAAKDLADKAKNLD